MVDWQEDNQETNIFFLQLPPMVPVTEQSSTAEGMEAANSLEQNKGSQPPQKTCTLNEFPSGSMGKLLVYRSGAVKLKLGNIVYDVSIVLLLNYQLDWSLEMKYFVLKAWNLRISFLEVLNLLGYVFLLTSDFKSGQVSSGMDCGFAQELAAINVEGKRCCIVGELSKRAVLTPDVDSMLKNIEDL